MLCEKVCYTACIYYFFFFISIIYRKRRRKLLETKKVADKIMVRAYRKSFVDGDEEGVTSLSLEDVLPSDVMATLPERSEITSSRKKKYYYTYFHIHKKKKNLITREASYNLNIKDSTSFIKYCTSNF